MAIDNYSNLKEAIEDWSHRLDIDLFVEDCITLCEKYIFKGVMPLKVGENEVSDTTTIATQESPLPARIIELVDMRVDYDGRYVQLKNLPPQQLPDIQELGRPCAYSIGGALYLDRQPDQAYTFKRRYFAAPIPLSDDEPVNDVLIEYPHLYLWGGVAAALFYSGEEEKATMWGERLSQGILDANQSYKNLQLGSIPTVIIHGGI